MHHYRRSATSPHKVPSSGTVEGLVLDCKENTVISTEFLTTIYQVCLGYVVTKIKYLQLGNNIQIV